MHVSPKILRVRSGHFLFIIAIYNWLEILIYGLSPSGKF